jgi:hypothetical protein
VGAGRDFAKSATREFGVKALASVDASSAATSPICRVQLRVFAVAAVAN